MYRQNLQQKMRELGISADGRLTRATPRRSDMRIVARLSNLVRGTSARWMRRRERRNPEAVYEAAIQRARRAVRRAPRGRGGRRALSAQQARQGARARQRRAQSPAARQLEIAVERDEDDRRARADRAPRRPRRRGRAPDRGARRAHRGGGHGQAEPGHVPERHRAAPRREGAHAGAARQRQGAPPLPGDALGSAPDADIRALESVREHINQLVTETKLNRELGDGELEQATRAHPRSRGRRRPARASSTR